MAKKNTRSKKAPKAKKPSAKKGKAKKPKKPKKPTTAPPANLADCRTLPIDDSIEQEQPNWCWAACIDVVVRYRSNPLLNQCDVATSALPPQNCCAKPMPSGCDVGQDTNQITALFNNTYKISATVVPALSAADLRAELTAKRLVGAHISWKSGGGHMLIVYGCSGKKFHVYDPYQGSGPITFTELRNYMDGEGTWDLSWRNL